MILRAIFELVYVLLNIVLIPINLPPLPSSVQTVVEQLTDILVGAVGLLSVFVDLSVLCALIPIVIVIANFDKIWKVIMFILRKIPFLGIK